MIDYILAAYFTLINLAAFCMMGIDKRRARRKGRRIPERQLITSALLGGSVGSLLGMLAFRHKTKHPKFTVGLPVILIIQIILGILVFKFIDLSSI